MRKKRQRKILLPAMFLIASVGLVWLISQQLRTPAYLPESAFAANAPAASVPALTSTPDFNMPPIDFFEPIIDRPIFSRSRRLPDDWVSVTPETPRRDLDLTLTGIIISSDKRIVVVSPKSGNNSVILRHGDQYEGWTVETIEPKEVTFQHASGQRRLQLTYDEPSSTNKQRRR